MVGPGAGVCVSMVTPIQVGDLDKVGVLGDLFDPSFPPNGFVEAENVRLLNGKVSRSLGRRLVAALPDDLYHLLFVAAQPSYWVIAGLNEVYTWNGVAFTEVTRVAGDYTASLDYLWNSDVFGGVAILNNGVDAPQYQTGDAFDDKFADFPAWPTNYKAKIVRSFLNYIIAYNITTASGNFPHMVKWSSPAAPGSMPSSWDATDPAEDANEIELFDSWAGPIIDALPLKDLNFVYKANSIWSMRPIPSAFVFDIKQVNTSVGLLAKNCVKPIANGSAHLFASHNDLYIFDGTEPRSALSKKVRDKYLALRSEAYIQNSFMVSNPRYKEILFCWPSESARWPNRALVINEETGAVSFRNLLPTPHMNLGDNITVADSWDTSSGAWDDDLSSWDSDAVFVSGQDLHSISTGPANFYQEDIVLADTDQGSKVVLVLSLEKNLQGAVVTEVSYHKTFLRAKLNLKGKVYWRIGGKPTVESDIVWSQKKVYDASQHPWIEAVVTNRILYLELSSINNYPFSFDSYEVQLTRKGRW